MTTPLESIEATVHRLRQSLSEGGYYAKQVDQAQEALDEAIRVRDSAQVELSQWEEVLSILRTQKDDLETFKKEFLRRHHPELVPHEGIRLYTEPEGA